MDESGAVVDDPTVSADQIVVMSGSGDGPDFRPSKLEILQSNADGAVSSAAAEQGLDQQRSPARPRYGRGARRPWSRGALLG